MPKKMHPETEFGSRIIRIDDALRSHKRFGGIYDGMQGGNDSKGKPSMLVWQYHLKPTATEKDVRDLHTFIKAQFPVNRQLKLKRLWRPWGAIAVYRFLKEKAVVLAYKK